MPYSLGEGDSRCYRNSAGTVQKHNQRTILFVDEVHRFNKSQQDALLPWVETVQSSDWSNDRKSLL